MQTLICETVLLIYHYLFQICFLSILVSFWMYAVTEYFSFFLSLHEDDALNGFCEWYLHTCRADGAQSKLNNKLKENAVCFKRVSWKDTDIHPVH